MNNMARPKYQVICPSERVRESIKFDMMSGVWAFFVSVTATP